MIVLPQCFTDTEKSFHGLGLHSTTSEWCRRWGNPVPIDFAQLTDFPIVGVQLHSLDQCWNLNLDFWPQVLK